MGHDRYVRQMQFGPWGEEGQRALRRACVGLVGCGGLGCTIAVQLVRAGVGSLRLIDSDRVSLDNLHRQVLYVEEDVASGRFKADIAAERQLAANSSVRIDARVGRLDEQNVGEFLEGVDMVVDGTDNFTTRFLLNAAAVRAGLPWIYGGVGGSSGMTMTVVPGEGPCLRCVFPDPPSVEEVVGIAPAVINTAVAVIGSLQSTEVFKLLMEPAARNRDLLTLDLWDMSFCPVRVERDPACPVCGSRPSPKAANAADGVGLLS